MLERVAKTILRYNMLPSGNRVIAAVSGGADSVCLLHLLMELAQQMDLHIEVAHYNHGWRGEASDGDERFVRDMASKFHLPFHVSRAETPPAQADREQAARRARQKFFASLNRDGSRIATGHTRDDQAETVLLRLLRGAGPTGLAGIWPQLDLTPSGAAGRRPWLVRPLLDFTREQLRAWLRARGQPWREDASNGQLDRARNRVRHLLLPALVSDFNPALTSRLAGLAELARADELYWRRRVRRYADRIWQPSNEPNGWSAERVALHRLPLALRRRLLREGVRRAKGNLRGLDFPAIERLVAMLAPGPVNGRRHERRLELAGVACRVDRHRLFLKGLQPPSELAEGHPSSAGYVRAAEAQSEL